MNLTMLGKWLQYLGWASERAITRRHRHARKSNKPNFFNLRKSEQATLTADISPTHPFHLLSAFLLWNILGPNVVKERSHRGWGNRSSPLPRPPAMKLLCVYKSQNVLKVQTSSPRTPRHVAFSTRLRLVMELPSSPESSIAIGTLRICDCEAGEWRVTQKKILTFKYFSG